MTTLVMKFGGASVGTTTALSQMLGIVLHEAAQWDHVVLIVSALDGVTDALIDAAHLAQFGNERGYRRIAANLRARHLALAEGLALGKAELAALQADLDKLLFDLLSAFQRITQKNRDALSAENLDAAVSMGERLAALIVAVLLRQHGLRAVAIDAADIIITDANFGAATPNLALTQERIDRDLRPMLERGILPVLTGFIGATPNRKPTTLGRGGSDYTASIIAVGTKATEVWVWSDVDGIMSADPHEVNDARVIRELSYAEMAELAYFGARILHARMVAPLRQNQIPLRVKNVYKPQLPGTVVHAKAASDNRIKSVTQIAGVSLAIDRSGPYGEIAKLIDQHMQREIGTPSDVMIATQSAQRTFITCVVPPSAGPDAVSALVDSLSHELNATGQSMRWHVEQVSIVTAIGDGINSAPRLTAKLFAALGDIPILAASFGAGGCSLSLVVRQAEGDTALREIHRVAISN
ncbi:MAG: aspartate kinase [Chloroflexi bacterium]|nr:aspartate kinase [Chloroflexota bacterium]